jgi:hypothetical protein
MSRQILRHCRTEWLMLDILVELLMCRRLKHELNVWSKSTRSSRVCGNVPSLIHNVLRNIKARELHDSVGTHKTLISCANMSSKYIK